MILGELSMVLAIGGGIPYIYQIVCGNVRPARATWFIWTVIMAIALGGYEGSGAADSAWFLWGDFIVTAVIFALSLWRGRGGWSSLDIACLGVAATSLGLWGVSDIALFALWGVLLADMVALVPTIIKALHDPFSEGASTFACSSAAALLGLLTVGEWNLTLLFYPAYLFLANLVTAITIIVGKYHTRRSVSQGLYLKP
jgi:hypothetical protein